MHTTRTAALALFVAGAGLAYSQTTPARREPAAKLLAPKPLPDGPAGVVSRGAAPDFSPFTTPSAAPAPKSQGGWLANSSPKTPTPPPTKPVSTFTPPAPQPSFVQRTWADVRGFVAGKPTPPTAPLPPGTPAFVEPAAVVAARPAAPPGVYAGPPAYRWYGWGTTTPGANAYAPAGPSPVGSSNWYTQTGATPGAFPVPVMNPARPAPGREPPAYAGGFAPPDVFVAPPGRATPPAPIRTEPVVVPVRTEPAPRRVVPTIPVPPAVPTDNAALPVVESSLPTIAVPTISAPTVMAPAETPAIIPVTADSPAPSLTWQKAPSDAIPFVPAAEAKAPAPLPVPKPAETPAGWTAPKAKPAIDDAIRAACQGRATVAEVRRTGDAKLLVRLAAATEADARAAAEAVSRLAELKPFEVAFEADLGR